MELKGREREIALYASKEKEWTLKETRIQA